MSTPPAWVSELKSITLHQDTGPPARLLPDGATAEYAAARQELLHAELALREHVAKVARLRRALPRGAVMPEYTFAEGPRDLETDGPVGRTTLRDLFGEHDTLVVYHLMFHPDDEAACPMCSLWVDGLHGVAHHLTRRSALAVIGRAGLPKLRRWARHRGWDGLRIASSSDNSFNADLQVEGPYGGQWPAVSVFTQDGDGVRHFLTQMASYREDTGTDSEGGGIDLLSPVWNVFDLLPQGRGDWYPDNDYPGRTRG
jgi:predicted dithiol-disulfide oxidoreductase (DUF899 family)